MEPNGVSPALARWSERLEGVTVTPLTRDYPEPQSTEAARQPFVLRILVSPEVTFTQLVRKVKEVSRIPTRVYPAC